MTQVSFLYSGSAGITARRTLIGDVLETRARHDSGTDFLVKSPDLPLSKWINAEFCTALPEVSITSGAPVMVVGDTFREHGQECTVVAVTASQIIYTWRHYLTGPTMQGYINLPSVAPANEHAFSAIERHAGIEKATTVAEASAVA